ncbi:hypothetical protein P7C71_g4164, partial [Lecanoromycetidae sp. Uapishka_2]
MLLRASKRSLRHDAYKQASATLEGIHLPFLCPALFEPSRHCRRTAGTSTTRSKARANDLIAQPVNKVPSLRRHLASAATIEYVPQEDSYIPFDTASISSHNLQYRFDAQNLSALRPFDPKSSPIIINDALSTHPKTFRAKDAINGNLNEIHQNLHACLQVGRLERAAALMRRLNQIYKPSAPGLLAAHNEYVKELSYRIGRTKDQHLLQHLQRWFIVDLKEAGVEPNAEIYAWMIQASLQTSGTRKDRTVRRYVNLAKEAGIHDDTRDLLSDFQRALVASSCRSNEIDAPVGDPPKESSGIYEAAMEDESKSVSEVKPMQQKGAGLATLKKSLEMFKNPGETIFTDHVNDVDAAVQENSNLPHEDRQRDRQRLLEANVINAAIERWRAEDAHLRSIGVNSGLSTSTIGAMMWGWHEKLVPVIKEDIRKSYEAEKKDKRTKAEDNYLQWGPYLQSLSPEKISAITILSAMKTASTDGVDERGTRLHHVVRSIGDAVQNESIAEYIRKNKNQADWKGLSYLARARSKHDNLTKLIQSSRSEIYEKLEWGEAMRIQLGAALLAHLMDIAKVQMSRRDPETDLQVQEAQPVFFHTYQYITGKRVGVMRLNSVVWEKLAKTPVFSALAKYLPMVAEPKPWAGYQEGGFLEHRLPVVRLHGSDLHSKRYAVTAAENGDMAQVFAGLDVLAKTPWKVNRFVFDVMLQAWNTGEAIAKIPPEDPPADYPPEPAESDDARERKRWMRKVREVENHRSGLRSTRCFQNFQLEVARAYLDETFYFPHNCDFRGRAYPMAPFLNHMGADNARGLLIFAHGKELTTEGLYWLKVHLANVYGYDKASFDERLQFTDEHFADICDSVNNPLNGSRWWLKAEDPWQCLAACKELKNALELPDPSKYVCRLAIHQDGTCNGLQHYAALGGDVAGAQQVNLEPGQRPSDIYTAVAELVKAEVATEAAQGKQLAKALDGKITRKVVKQTVMTNVYGVTFTGAKRQVRKQLDELIESFPETYEVNRAAAAPYIARKIFSALATMFNGAHDIQYWLTDCAARISESLAPEQVAYIERASKGEKPFNSFKTTQLKGNPKNELTSFKSTVIWTTPLKMPVVQPYRKKSSRRIETNLQKITIMNRSAADPVHKAKQLQAFPPNFIHSLDATHMFLTALKCNEVDLTFAAIHDSFWTHAGDVNIMNRIIRDAFIRMHSEDIIGRLAAEFKARYKGYMHLASVRTDTPIGQRITAWRRSDRGITGHNAGKKHAKTIEARKTAELLTEIRRRDLLASDDPKEREEGEKMVTAGKIFEQARDEKALASVGMKTATIGGLGPSPTSSSSRAAKLKANMQLDVGDLENTEAVQPVHGEDFVDTARGTPMATEDGAFPAADDGEDADGFNPEEADDVDDTDLVIHGKESLKTHVQASTATRKVIRRVWVWLPLTFPPVPKKGDFDVTRLKDSQYFFS